MVKYFKGIFLLGCFYFNSENYGSDDAFLKQLVEMLKPKEGGCCKNIFCCGNPHISVLLWTPIITLGGSLIAVIVKAILQTRFKRLIGRRIRARKKEVKKYGIIKDVNLYDVVDEMKKEISSNVIGQEVAIQHLLDTFEIFLENKNQCMALILDGVSGVGKNLSLSIVLKHILDKKNYLIIDPSSYDPASKNTFTQQIFEGEKYVNENREHVVPSRLLLFLERLEKEDKYGFVVVNDAHKILKDEFMERVRSSVDNGFLIINNKRYNMNRIKWVFTSNQNFDEIKDDSTKSLFDAKMEKSIENRFFRINYPNLSGKDYSTIAKNRMSEFMKKYKVAYITYDDSFCDAIGLYCEKLNVGVRSLDRIFLQIEMKIKKYLYKQKKNNVKKNMLFSFDQTTGLVSLEINVDAPPLANDLDAPPVANDLVKPVANDLVKNVDAAPPVASI